MMNSQGWLDNVRQVPSPNYNERPSGGSVDLLVIHNISLPPNEFGGGYIEQFFTNTLSATEHCYFQGIADMTVSAHFLIDRHGGVTQFVPLTKRAWHAGQSCFDGRANCNDFSIGIELEGADDIPFTERQYESLATLTQQLLMLFPDLSGEKIVGHSDIAPGRKTDPGPVFDWPKYQQLLQSC